MLIQAFTTHDALYYLVCLDGDTKGGEFRRLISLICFGLGGCKCVIIRGVVVLAGE